MYKKTRIYRMNLFSHANIATKLSSSFDSISVQPSTSLYTILKCLQSNIQYFNKILVYYNSDQNG